MTSARRASGIIAAAVGALVMGLHPGAASAQGLEPPRPPSASDKVDRLLDRGKAMFAHQQFDQAIAVDEQALALSEKELGEGPDTGRVLTDLGLLYASAGRYDDAEKAYLRALAIHNKAYGEDSAENVTLLNDVGLLYLNTDRADKALPYLEHAYAICGKRLRRGDPKVKSTRGNLADAYRKLGRQADADALDQAPK